jgi:hypothetical protein
MGSKTIIFLGLLISAAYLYFSISKYKAPHIESEAVKTEVVEKAVLATETVAKIEEAAPVEEKIVQNINERISIPAFGFMSGDKNQIVALMSDNDENGLLAKHIEELCKKKECSKDMRYEKDIIDAPWQKESMEIIDLLLDGSIDNGSLFIEGNVLKLEGTVKDKKTEDTLTAILDATKSDTFKVENYIKFSSKTIKNSEVKTKEVEPVETKPNPKVEKVTSTPAPITTIEDAVIDTTPEVVPETIVENTTDEVKPAVKDLPTAIIKKATSKSKTKNKVVRTKTVPKKDVIAAPVMETTLDAEERVRKILDEIKSSKPAVGVVAKPYMETTAE